MAAAAPMTAAAAPPELETPPPKRWRVHVDTSVGGWTHGLGRDTFDALWILGPGRSRVGLGYAITPMLVLGARIGGGAQRQSYQFADGPDMVSRGGYVSVAPYLELRWPRPGIAQPFAELSGGVWLGGHRSGEFVGRWLSPEVAGTIGSHFFIVRTVSIDVSVRASYDRHYYRGTGVDSAQAQRRWAFSNHSTTLAAVAGVSVWW